MKKIITGIIVCLILIGSQAEAGETKVIQEITADNWQEAYLEVLNGLEFYYPGNEYPVAHLVCRDPYAIDIVTPQLFITVSDEEYSMEKHLRSYRYNEGLGVLVTDIMEAPQVEAYSVVMDTSLFQNLVGNYGSFQRWFHGEMIQEDESNIQILYQLEDTQAGMLADKKIDLSEHVGSELTSDEYEEYWTIYSKYSEVPEATLYPAESTEEDFKAFLGITEEVGQGNSPFLDLTNLLGKTFEEVDTLLERSGELSEDGSVSYDLGDNTLYGCPGAALTGEYQDGILKSLTWEYSEAGTDFPMALSSVFYEICEDADEWWQMVGSVMSEDDTFWCFEWDGGTAKASLTLESTTADETLRLVLYEIN